MNLGRNFSLLPFTVSIISGSALLLGAVPYVVRSFALGFRVQLDSADFFLDFCLFEHNFVHESLEGGDTFTGQERIFLLEFVYFLVLS